MYKFVTMFDDEKMWIKNPSDRCALYSVALMMRRYKTLQGEDWSVIKKNEIETIYSFWIVMD